MPAACIWWGWIFRERGLQNRIKTLRREKKSGAILCIAPLALRILYVVSKYPYNGNCRDYKKVKSQSAENFKLGNLTHGSSSFFIHCVGVAVNCVRGLWLRYGASLKQITGYEKDNINISFREMIEIVESSYLADSVVLSSLKQKSWKLMNSFTHSGFQHHVRRNVDGVTGSKIITLQKFVLR